MAQAKRKSNGVFDTDTYLARVGLSAAPQTSEDGLRQLHNAQFFSIPFENLDIQLGRGINLAAAHLVRKLVGQARGGYCFELNGLMLMALREFGFKARPLLARVHLQTPPSGRTHQVNCVEMGDRLWLVDVGFGAGGPRRPLPLQQGCAGEGPGWAYRLERREPWGWLLQTLVDGQWRDSYSFDLGHVTAEDIAVSNHYTSTAPGIEFTQARVASAPRPRGRVSLFNFTLTEIQDGQKSSREIAPGQDYLDVLSNEFGIELGVPYADLRQPAELTGQ